MTRERPGAHLDPGRLVPHKNDGGTAAPLAADERPIPTLRPLVQEMDRRAQSVETAGAAGDKERIRRGILGQIVQIDALELEPDGGELGITQDVLRQSEELRRIGGRDLDDANDHRIGPVDEVHVRIPAADHQRFLRPDADFTSLGCQGRRVRGVDLGGLYETGRVPGGKPPSPNRWGKTELRGPVRSRRRRPSRAPSSGTTKSVRRYVSFPMRWARMAASVIADS